MLEHVGHLQILVIDGVVLAHQVERGLLVKISPLAAHPLLRRRKQYDCLATSVAALLAPRHPALGGLERALGLAIPTGMADACAIRQRSERLAAEAYPSFLPRHGKRLHWHLRAG